MNESSREIDIIRDAEGRITKIENPDGFLASGDSAMIVAFVDTVRMAVKDFDKNTQKYSKRMERLTIAMTFLAVVQIAVTAITIYIASVVH